MVVTDPIELIGAVFLLASTIREPFIYEVDGPGVSPAALLANKLALR